jgi:hypothetical protein
MIFNLYYLNYIYIYLTMNNILIRLCPTIKKFNRRFSLFNFKQFSINKSIFNKKIKITKTLHNAGINNDNTIDVTNINKNLENTKTHTATPTPAQISSEITDQNRNSNFPPPNYDKNYDSNFDVFKKRNKELNKKAKAENKITDKIGQEDNGKKEPTYIDEKMLAKLQQLINDDKENFNVNDFKSLNKPGTSKVEEQELKSTGGEINPRENVLVVRPSKNFVWGLGEQTKLRKCKLYNII